MIKRPQRHLSKKALYFKNLNTQFAKNTPFQLLRFLKKRCANPTKKFQTIQFIKTMFPFLSYSTSLSIFIQASKMTPSKLKRISKSHKRAAPTRTKQRKLTLSAITKLTTLSAYKISRVPYFVFYDLTYPVDTLRSRYLKFPRTITPLVIQSLKLTNDAMRPLFTLSDHLTQLLDLPWISKWAEFTRVYGSFYELPQIQLYVRAHSNTKYPVRHLIRFKFLGSKLALSLVDHPSHKTHFFASPGLLIKHFNFKKSLKKSKSMKLLTMRFLRKLLILIRFKSLTIHAKGVPLFLDTLISTLYRPIAHPMINPLTGSVIDEITNKPRNLLINGVTFFHPKPYGSQKQKKKGRVKRKIRRKVMKSNNVIDEM